MTQSLEALARRTDSMGSIRGIVHTMKTLSVINSVPYEHAARGIEAYHDTVLDGLHAYLSQSGPLGAETSEYSAKVIVVFGSDHGLCGNYNEALAAHIRRGFDVDSFTTVLCIGAQMADALIDRGFDIDNTFFPPASVDGIGRIANILTRELDRIRRAASPQGITVSLGYFARGKAGLQTPVISKLLPLDPSLLSELRTKPWQSRSLPYFAMPRDELFMALIRNHLFASIFRAAAEAMVTENAARLALMQQAEQSVDEKLEELQSETRALRQADITTELLDVIIGFEALKKTRPTQSKPEAE